MWRFTFPWRRRRRSAEDPPQSPPRCLDLTAKWCDNSLTRGRKLGPGVPRDGNCLYSALGVMLESSPGISPDDRILYRFGGQTAIRCSVAAQLQRENLNATILEGTTDVNLFL